MSLLDLLRPERTPPPPPPPSSPTQIGLLLLDNDLVSYLSPAMLQLCTIMANGDGDAPSYAFTELVRMWASLVDHVQVMGKRITELEEREPSVLTRHIRRRMAVVIEGTLAESRDLPMDELAPVPIELAGSLLALLDRHGFLNKAAFDTRNEVETDADPTGVARNNEGQEV